MSSFWKVTVGGTAGGVPYGVGDTLVYSKTLTQFYKIDNTESVSSVNGQSGAVLVEPVIAAGTAAQMLLGNKTWASVLSQVQGTLLTGLSLATGTAITAADTVLSGLGKLQKQITDAATNLAANVRSTAITGYVVGSNAALAATDTVLGAFGKLQAQITGLGTSKLDATANAVSATKLATASTINGVAFDGTANITVDDPTKVPLAGGNLTGDLIYQNVGVGGWARGLTAKIQSTAAYAAGIGFYGSGDSVTTVYLGLGAGPWSSGNGVRVTAAGVTISGATTFDTLITGSVNGNAATATTLTGLTPTVAELNYVDGVTSSIQTQLNAKAPLASPALTGVPTVPTAAVGNNTTQVASTAYTVAEIGSRAPTKTGGGASGSWGISVTGSSASCSGLAASATTLTGLTATVTELNYTDGVTSAIQTQLDGKAPLTGAGTSGTWGISVTGSSGSCTGNASSATTLSGDQSNWASLRSNAVANMLGWKNYGNGHVIFDASAGTAPNGTAINNTTPGIAWAATYPTLMGWNGSTTYGVRVDRATWADRCADTGWITLSLYNGFTHDANYPLQIRRIGNIVYATGLLNRATPPAGLTEFTTIPSGYRPTKNTTGIVGMNAENFNWTVADVGVGTNGRMGIGLVGIPTQNNPAWGINMSWVTDYA